MSATPPKLKKALEAFRASYSQLLLCAHELHTEITIAAGQPDSDDERIQRIVMFVADAYELKPAQLIGPLRSVHLIAPRHLAMTFVMEFTGATQQACGKAFGGRDHGTVIHAMHRIKERTEVDPAFACRVLFLRKRCCEILAETKAA